MPFRLHGKKKIDLPYKVKNNNRFLYPLSGAYEGGVQNQHCMSFIIPTSVFQQQWPENTLRRLFFHVDDEHIPAVQEMLDAYTKTIDTSLPVTSRKTMMEQYETETRASKVMGNTISVIIALVGVLNFINSMVTAIVSRKKEFVMIQSVGMTKRQLRKMLIEKQSIVERLRTE